jgi:deoxyribonucleoside regulator
MTEERILSKVAELFYIYDLSQLEIADKLGFSKAKISRILKEAKQKKIIEFNIKSNQYEKRTLEFERRLEQLYDLKEAIIYYDSDITDQSDEIIFNEVGSIGAHYIERILRDGLNIALTWGKTLYNVIDKIKPEIKYPNTKVFSTLGGVSLTKAEYQNNNLTTMLAEKVSGTGYPVYLPLFVTESVSRELVEKEINIYKILESPSKIDYYITGVGPISSDSRLYIYSGVNLDFIQNIRNKGAVGEIGWNFYDKDGNFIKTGVEDDIVNLPVSEIIKTKTKVTIAFGKEKVEVLKAFLKTNITNILITDSLTAQAILEN